MTAPKISSIASRHRLYSLAGCGVPGNFVARDEELKDDSNEVVGHVSLSALRRIGEQVLQQYGRPGARCGFSQTIVLLEVLGASQQDSASGIEGSRSALAHTGEIAAAEVPALNLAHQGGGAEPSPQPRIFSSSSARFRSRRRSWLGPTQWNGRNGNNNAGHSNRRSGSGSQRNDRSDNAGQSNREKSPTASTPAGTPNSGGSPFREQYNGGNGHGNARQSNYDASGGPHNGLGKWNSDGGQWNSGGGLSISTRAVMGTAMVQSNVGAGGDSNGNGSQENVP
ncbi:hypothetical protein BV20DRAFT_1114316 [Pilatotrama ljubarskyi]|nr:hypothetical protein BV20DRAFT_1114316 [Pilatotrama ljubarskyi]